MKIEVQKIKPSKQTKVFHILAFRGHTEKLQTQLDYENIYQPDAGSNLTAVFWALLGRRLDIVDILLEVYEKDLSVLKANRKTLDEPHYVAFNISRDEVLEYQSETSPNSALILLKTNNTTIPDCVRIDRNNLAAGQLLDKLKHNGTCDINGRALQYNDTLLHVAAFFGYQHVVERLLKQGANPNILNDHKQSALWYALYTGQLEISKILAWQPKFEFWQHDIDNNSLARAAACSGNYRTFEYTIDKMLNATGLVYVWDELRKLLSETCVAGDSTLHEIARRGHYQLLKESRATLYIWEEDMARPNAAGETVMHIFCQHDVAAHTESLLKFAKKYPALLKVPRTDGKFPLDVLANAHRKNLKLFEELRDKVSLAD